ncbi:MAG TPA: hypothetical protein VGF06_17180, partial [Terriglobales bacterium]
MRSDAIRTAHSFSRGRAGERGYILLTLMLFVALLTIAAVAVVPTIEFQVKRDREEEMIHRGVQYSRAVRRYVKKFGRYPTRIEDLVSTNQVRFLRKKYKDPITGEDFKILRMGDVQLMPGVNQIAGVSPLSAGPAGLAGSALAQQGAAGMAGQQQNMTTGTSGASGQQQGMFSNSASSTENAGGSSATGLSTGQA